MKSVDHKELSHPHGPLDGIRIVEFAGIGPAPFAAMLLADLGADVLRIENPRPSRPLHPGPSPLSRGRRSVVADLKEPRDLEAVLRLIERSDVLIEGFRPGVMERLGLGPDVCFEGNPRLVYGRMTGWGQEGPLARAAGHDVNYIALAGALAHIGPPEQPVIPLNLLGDFGGGALYLALGVVAALFEASRSALGQIVDAAVIDGVASMMTSFYALASRGELGPRGSNLLDGGAPFYSVYECADGAYVAVGALEGKFYAELIRRLGLEDELPAAAQYDRASWGRARDFLGRRFRERTRDEWCAILEGSDVCFAPVLSLDEAPEHEHHRVRETFVEIGGVVQAAAPRFSRTPARLRGQIPAPKSLDAALDAWGVDACKRPASTDNA